MVGYYIYGRDSVNNYHSYINSYSPDDEKKVFNHMVGYQGPQNAAASQRPDKIYYFNFPSSKGRAALIGKTTYNTGKESPMADELKRSSVFMHQYLFDGEDRDVLMQDPDRIFCVRPFCTRVEDILVKKEDNMRRTRYTCTFDASRQDVFEEREQRWELPELLDYFGLDDAKLEELLYTAVHCEEKAYIMLPENTKEATDRAQELMRKLFSVFPPVLMETAGFQTYTHGYADYNDPDRYIPVGVRFVFLANSQRNIDNASRCKSELRSFLFCPACDSGVRIPEELYPVVQAMKQKLLTGETDEMAELFWSLFNEGAVGKEAARISEKEKICLYRFAENYAQLAVPEGGRLAGTEEVFYRCVDGLLEKPEHWTSDFLENIIARMVTDYLWTGQMTKAFYPLLFKIYDMAPGCRKDVENYFAEQIQDLNSMRYYDQHLQPDQALRSAVFDLLYQKESCHKAVLEIEFGQVFTVLDDRAASPVSKAEALWDLVANLGGKNPELIRLPETAEYAEEFLRRVSQECGTEQARELLEYSQQRIRALGSGLDGCRAALCRVSKEYIGNLGPVAKLRNEDLEQLRMWPADLMDSSMLEEMDRNIRSTEILRKAQSVVKSRDSQKILKYLESNQDNDTFGILCELEEAQSLVKKILITARNLDSEVKAKKVEKEKLFDDIHEQMLFSFTDYTEMILGSIMRSSLGGVAGMASLYKRIRKYDTDRDYMEYLRDCMHDAVLKYFEEYEMDRQDKKAIRQERSFLAEIHIQADQLLGK